MLKRIGVVVFLAFGFFVVIGNQAAAGQSTNLTADDDNRASASIAPPFLTPGKSKFVTREGDPFVVTVTATCLLEDASDTQFELLLPTPAFVHVSAAYRNEQTLDGYAEGLGVVYITPQIGDAGKHIVSLQVKSCGGKVERVITFKVNVTPAHQD